MPERKTSRYLFPSIVVLATILLISLIIARSRAIARDETRHAAVPTSTPLVTFSDTISKLPSDVALAHEIDLAIDQSNQKQARWGVFVMSLNDGRVIYSRNGDGLFTPASNMKIYTTAVALDLLGADYRWRTSVYAAREPDTSGAIDGDLVLYGRGAPDLVSFRRNDAPSLADLADQLYQHGVREVRGHIVGDESYFSGELYGNGWQWNDLQWYFGAQPSALTVDANAVELTITPGNKVDGPADLKLNRQTGYVRLANNTITVARGAATTIGINRGLSDNDVRVWGEFPAGGRGFTAYLSVANPALWAATLFKEALVARGIRIDGEARSRDSRVPEAQRFDPQQTIELAHLDSEALGQIVRATNKESINLNAELLLRTLGKERGIMAPDPDPRKMKQRGDDEAGVAVIKLWLERAGISGTGLEVMDGSGLSRLDLVSPETTVQLLTAISKTNSYSIFHDSLPVAGRDGTLKGRLALESGRIAAKTGSLTFDHSLSGYATTQSNEVLVFSILCNDAMSEKGAVRTIDQIAGLLVSFNRNSTRP
jgi:D-alanyl-D-alanine carboxypeptidase/D-alanyl-D-alanine-endopeptidase (penicillin-binding protein 4)